MAPKVWATSNNGEIIYKSLTSEYIEGACEVMKSFYVSESVCRAVKLAENEDAMAELNELSLCTARDGVSVVAVEKKTNTVCAVAFNKLQVPNNPEDDTFFAKYAKTCKNPKSRWLVEFMDDADATCDLFSLCEVDCLLEMMFLATVPEFRTKGIASKVTEVTTEIARRLCLGENVKQSIDGTELKIEPVPKLVAALFTSPSSQSIGRSADWKVASTLDYEEVFYEGESFASLLEKTNRSAEIQYKRIY